MKRAEIDGVAHLLRFRGKVLHLSCECHGEIGKHFYWLQFIHE